MIDRQISCCYTDTRRCLVYPIGGSSSMVDTKISGRKVSIALLHTHVDHDALKVAWHKFYVPRCRFLQSRQNPSNPDRKTAELRYLPVRAVSLLALMICMWLLMKQQKLDSYAQDKVVERRHHKVSERELFTQEDLANLTRFQPKTFGWPACLRSTLILSPRQKMSALVQTSTLIFMSLCHSSTGLTNVIYHRKMVVM